MKKIVTSDIEISKMQKIAGIVRESQTVDDNFKQIKSNQAAMKNAAELYRKKAEELGVDRGLIGDFNKALNNLEDAIFKANYKK